jgi:hypothetical protein
VIYVEMMRTGRGEEATQRRLTLGSERPRVQPVVTVRNFFS